MLQLRYKNSNKNPLWLVESKYSIGSGTGCDLKIDGSILKDLHANLLVKDEVATIENLIADKWIKVNGIPVMEKKDLKHGDVLKLGDVEMDLVDPKSLKKEPEKVVTKDVHDWSLQALNTALKEKEFPILGTKVLGRSNDCDISLGVAHLSRRHAKLKITAHGMEVEDLKSSNGTFVNGQKIERAVLKVGDELSFDTLRFRVLGPQQDVEQTTVRPVLRVPGEQSRAASAKTAESAKKSAHDKPKKTGKKNTAHVESLHDKPSKKAGHVSASAVNNSSSQSANDDGKGGIPAFAWVAIILALGGAAWFLSVK